MTISNAAREDASGRTALVVDDSSAIRTRVAAAFLADGFGACKEAENGRQAIEMARRTKPDVIILDLSMPEMNGIEAASELKKLLPDVPIILFTLYGNALSQKDAAKAGIDSVLLKGAPLSTLVGKAHELMRR